MRKHIPPWIIFEYSTLSMACTNDFWKMITVSSFQQQQQQQQPRGHLGGISRTSSRKTVTCCSSSPLPTFGKNNDEAPSLIALCEDLDWKSRAEALRQQALRYEQPGGRITPKSSSSSSSSSTSHGFKAGNGRFNHAEWDYSDAVLRLRRQASSKVAEELAEKLDASPDQVSKLTSYIMNQACKLAEEKDDNGRKAAASIFLLPIIGCFHSATLGAANAADANEAAKGAAAASAAAPSWLGIVILGTPVVSYLLFNVYRDKVNPYANITDFLFGMGALFIVGNLVTIATLGVRLY